MKNHLNVSEINKLSPEEIKQTVIKIYRGKCVYCRHSTEVVHEIVFRSRISDWWKFENRVLLCITCHRWAHDNPSKSGKILLEYRDQRLREYGYTEGLKF